MLDSVAIARKLGSGDVSLWLPDGSNYSGTQSIRNRIAWLGEVLVRTHKALGPNQRLPIDYKPFEPAFYHTDIADWGMSAHPARNIHHVAGDKFLCGRKNGRAHQRNTLAT